MLIPVSEMKTWDVDKRLEFLKLNNSLPLEDLAFLRTKTRSKLAQYYIMSAYMWDESISFVAATNRWLQDIRYGSRLHQLLRDAQSRFPESLLYQALYFVSHVMHFFNFGTAYERKDSTRSACCKYDLDANNFIRTLTKSRLCNCACFATYVKSAAEEFGLGDYVKLCEEPEHVSVVVIDPEESQQSLLSAKKAWTWNQIEAEFNVNKYVFKENEVKTSPLVLAKIESSCSQVQIHTILEPFEFVNIFLPDAFQNDYGLAHVSHIDCDNHLNKSDFLFLVWEVLTHPKRDTVFTELFLIAEIFQQQEWMDAFLRFGLCRIEHKWLEHYITQPLPDHVEDAWERYFVEMPEEHLGRDLSDEEASRFMTTLELEANEVLDDWYDMNKTGYEPIIMCLLFVRGLELAICPKREQLATS
jgi:hypothetical protein